MSALPLADRETVGCTQLMATDTGCEAIPFATTTRVLGPAGVVFGTVKLVDEEAPGAIETEVQLAVRA